MMAPGLYATTAVLAAAPVPQGPPGITTPQQEERRPTQADLYAAFPTRPDSSRIAGRFYTAYGSSLANVELDQGTRLAGLAVAPPTPPRAAARAGIGSSGSPWTVVLVGLLLAALALGAMLLAPSAARAKVPDGFVGITTEDAYTGDNDYARKQLGAQKKAGFTVARQVFRWNEIEPKSGDYDFSATDRFVRNAALEGMRVMPLLQGEPEWATSRPTSGKRKDYRGFFPPKDNATLARFGAVLARRYGPEGDFWKQNDALEPKPFVAYQIWNEPNFPTYWGGRPSAKAYGKMLREVAGSIRSVDEDAYIVTAGIPDSKLGQPPAKFIRTMLRSKSTRASIDAIGIHPYSKTVKTVMQITRDLRKTVNRSKGKKIDLWVTEIGWAAGGPKTPKRTVSYSRQGPLIREAFRQLARSRKSLRLRGIIYYAWRDFEVYEGGKDFWGLHTGLLKRNGKPKRSYKVVTRALRKLK